MTIMKQLFDLNKMSKRSVGVYHRFALSAGLSDSSLGVLYALLGREECSQYDLCTEWSIPKQTINTTVRDLQSKGWVRLAPVAGTRNKKRIVLTDEGRTFAERTVRVLMDAELGALGELSEEERAEYIRLNEKYNRSLTEKLEGILTK